MKLNSKKSLQILVLATLVGSMLSTVGCGNSEDGPMLSDAEKLEKMNQGRQAYSSGQRDGGSKTQGPGEGSK